MDAEVALLLPREANAHTNGWKSDSLRTQRTEKKKSRESRKRENGPYIVQSPPICGSCKLSVLKSVELFRVLLKEELLPYICFAKFGKPGEVARVSTLGRGGNRERKAEPGNGV